MTGRFEDELRIAIMKLSRRMRQERADGTVTDGQLSVLFALHRYGPQTLGSLSEHEGVTPPSMNRTVNGLVDAGLVSRATSPEDGRKVDIEITDAGVEIVSATRRRRIEWFSGRLAALGAKERAALETATAILREIADA